MKFSIYLNRRVFVMVFPKTCKGEWLHLEERFAISDILTIENILKLPAYFPIINAFLKMVYAKGNHLLPVDCFEEYL